MTAPNPYQLPDPISHAVALERQRHDQALYSFGEYAFLVMMWTIFDFEAGLVDRCSRCFVGNGQIVEVYQQANDPKCPVCYGTTFEGGVRARVIRPILWESPSDSGVQYNARGVEYLDTGNAQIPSDVHMHAQDYIFRADGTRWEVGRGTHGDVRTGFQFHDSNIITGYSYASVDREDESSVAYLIPPSPTDTISILTAAMRSPRVPQDFSAYELINGPLITP